MKHSIADFPGPVLATIGFPGLRHEDRIRFLSRLALTGCGAVMFLSDLIARFATVAGGRGAADAERDIRGFAVNFCTEEGNWDN